MIETIITVAATAAAYWALLWLCNRAPAGSKREAVARVLSGGGPRPKVGA